MTRPEALELRRAELPSVQYLWYLPAAYGRDADRLWPLVLFLHGGTEYGSNVWAAASEGLTARLARDADFSLPAIVVAPHCPPGEFWDVDALDALLREFEASHAVDLARVYVTGLSLGGFGTWQLAAAYPERFAALAPISGGGDPATAARIAHIPQWVFHGALDDVIPVRRSVEMVEALQAAGAGERVRLTIYPDLQHDSWTTAYATPELYDWLFAQRR